MCLPVLIVNPVCVPQGEYVQSSVAQLCDVFFFATGPCLEICGRFARFQWVKDDNSVTELTELQGSKLNRNQLYTEKQQSEVSFLFFL